MMNQNVPIVQMPKTWVLCPLDFPPIYRILEGVGGKNQDFHLWLIDESETENI